MVEHIIWSVFVAILGIALFVLLLPLLGPWAIIPSIILIVVGALFAKW